MIQLIRTDSDNEDFRKLVVLLDRDLYNRYLEKQSFFNQFNKLDKIQHVVVAYKDGRPVGCGAFKKYSESIAEVKRMFVDADCRGEGIALQVLAALETWAWELGFSACILETGKKQPEAIRLYQKAGYYPIPNYGQYAGVDMCICMQKELIPANFHA